MSGDWLRDFLPQSLFNIGPWRLMWWQLLAFPVLIVVTLAIGRALGAVTRSILLRITRRTASTWDDRLLARISGVERPWEALAALPSRGKSSADVQRLAAVLSEVASLGRPGDQLARILAYYGPVLRRIHPEDYPKRERDLEHFATIAERYRSTQSLLADMALEPPSDSVAGVLAADGEDEGLVTLSTIHSAKGLEWHSVFVLWVADGRFPSMYGVRDDDDIEEERRLMYVAVTRAKDHLYLTYPIETYERGMGLVMAKPSRFIEGLDEDVLEPIALVDEIYDA